MTLKEAFEISELFDCWDFDFHFCVYFGGAACYVQGIAIWSRDGSLKYSVCV